MRAHGYAYEVIAPAKLAGRPGDRIRTDRRDALLLARAARSGELVSVVVPEERDEALRDLSRAREDAVRARLKARQQLKAMLLRHRHRYSGRPWWTEVVAAMTLVGGIGDCPRFARPRELMGFLRRVPSDYSRVA